MVRACPCVTLTVEWDVEFIFDILVKPEPQYILSFSVNDTLDDIFDASGDEEEQDAIVNQVLDEIGIEISGKVRV